MTHNKILITGGAGFIGQKLATKLLEKNAKVCIFDSFNEQTHSSQSLPNSLRDKVKLVKADIRDRESIIASLSGIECVVHLAAETGTGQSMYEIQHYYDVNVLGTALLLDVIQNEPVGKTVKSIVLASSRAIYGEGAYKCIKHNIVYPNQRTKMDLSCGKFEPICPICGDKVLLEKTKENSPKKSMSIYALTKQAQEEAILLFASTFKHDINVFSLRFQNVFGPGQSLKNPYTGILAVFSNLARQGEDIDIYEDGNESRDFVYIDDAVEAIIKCINYKGNFIGSLNVGSGVATSVLEVATHIKEYYNSKSQLVISGSFRLGDIRHNIADISIVELVLGFQPKTSFKEGLDKFLYWANLESCEDNLAYEKSVKELSERGLMGYKSK